jgi:hypothetical protein
MSKKCYVWIKVLKRGTQIPNPSGSSTAETLYSSSCEAEVARPQFSTGTIWQDESKTPIQIMFSTGTIWQTDVPTNKYLDIGVTGAQSGNQPYIVAHCLSTSDETAAKKWINQSAADEFKKDAESWHLLGLNIAFTDTPRGGI